MRRLVVLATLPLLAQSQSTFYAAYEDGLEMERAGDWKGAWEAYRRAAALHPAPSRQVLTYGNNLLNNYYPYTRMARCLLELGDPAAAASALAHPQAASEPRKEREELARRIKELQAAATAVPPPPPPPANPSPAPPLADTPSSRDQSAEAPTPAQPVSSPTLDPRTEGPGRTHPAASAPAPSPASPAAAPPAAAPLPPASAPQAADSGHPASWWPWLVLALPAGAWLWFWRHRPRPAGAFNEPEQIGPYRIERLLGRGGFASTYLARHGATGRRVALKRLHPYRLDDPEFLARFQLEARLGAQLRHPNLVALVDTGSPGGPPWIAMDYVEGVGLDIRLKESGALPFPEILRIAREIAAGLSYAHGMGVVHRDLKPANVMLSSSGAKIMDFGIARVIDSETLTTTYAFLGTPRYAAPEAQMKTAVGPASDWYAFGIMLFEMISGRTPFQGETPFEILERHRSEPLPDLRELRPDTPGPLAALVEGLCAKSPEARPGQEEILSCLQDLGA